MIGVMPATGGRGTGNMVLTAEGTGREMRKSCSMLARDEQGYWRAVCEETRPHGSEGGGRKRTGLDTTRKGFWRVETLNSTSPAPYPTNDEL
jgi:hypothetical protein